MPIHSRFEFRHGFDGVLAFPFMHFGYPIVPIKDNIEKTNPWEQRMRETELFKKGISALKASLDETKDLKLRKCLGLTDDDKELKNSFGSK